MNFFKSWKTSVPSAITAIAAILKFTGIVEMSDEVLASITTIMVIVIGWFAKDADQTGTTEKPR